MKIAHLCTAREWRGGQQQCLALAQGLQSRGVEQFFFAPPDSPLYTAAEAAGIPTVPSPVKHRFDLPGLLRLGQYLRQERIALLHAHDAHAVFATALAGRWARVARIGTRRTCFSLRSRWLYQYGLDRLICISRAVQAACLTAGLSPAALPVVHSGVCPDPPAPTRSMRALRAELGIDRRADVLLNIAALTEEKRHNWLLEAMLCVVRDRPATHLLIAGHGPLEGSVKAHCQQLALDHRVHFLGFQEETGSLHALADLFVITSRSEGLCTSVLDAMMRQRACVVTDAGGLSEAVEDGLTGRVVDRDDPERFAAAVVELLDDRKRRLQMGRAARQRALGSFTTDHMVEGTLAVYRDRLAPPEEPPR